MLLIVVDLKNTIEFVRVIFVSRHFHLKFAFCSASRSVRFKEHLNSNEPKDVLSTEEYEELRASCRQSQKAERAEQSQEETQERPPGEEKPATPEGLDTVRNKVCALGFKLG